MQNGSECKHSSHSRPTSFLAADIALVPYVPFFKQQWRQYITTLRLTLQFEAPLGQFAVQDQSLHLSHHVPHFIGAASLLHHRNAARMCGLRVIDADETGFQVVLARPFGPNATRGVLHTDTHTHTYVRVQPFFRIIRLSSVTLRATTKQRADSVRNTIQQGKLRFLIEFGRASSIF